MKAEWTNKDSLSIESTGQKAIIVIDMPNNCSECSCCNERECGNEYKGYVDGHLEWNSGRPSWCPLRPIPEKMTLNGAMNVGYGTDGFAYRNGWNACIDEIFGETE